jgi:NADPH-dependent F420 reductase
MDVAIIGAGNVGGALAQAFSRAGHSVTITSRTQEKAETVARESGAKAARSNKEAVEGAEVVILAVPYTALDEVAEELGSSLEGKAVVDTMNRFNPDDPAATIDGTSSTEQLHAKIPGARIVKAFNYLFASRMADPTVDGVELDAYIAGEDEEAKSQVAELARAIGLRPIEVGGVGMARAL